MPKEQRLIHGASGLGDTELVLNYSKILSSTDGIMFGGLINGKLNDGFMNRKFEKPGNTNFTV